MVSFNSSFFCTFPKDPLRLIPRLEGCRRKETQRCPSFEARPKKCGSPLTPGGGVSV